jgi:hypothetical protein
MRGRRGDFASGIISAREVVGSDFASRSGLRSSGASETLMGRAGAMRYQLILQLPAFSAEDYDEMIELEEIIIGHLANLGCVDGHDAGSGEMNIFILTDSPKAAFDRIGQMPAIRNVMPDLKAAYREIGKDDFTILHPIGLTRFTIA